MSGEELDDEQMQCQRLLMKEWYRTIWMKRRWMCQNCLKHFERDLYSVVQINSFFC